jgi:glycosyltransferase involved in cell wall biosynthesis
MRNPGTIRYLSMATADPLVSVGVPVRNGEDRVAAAVESALSQVYGNIQVVISDNASTDATEEVCRSLARRDPRVHYHRHAENVGLLNNFIAAMELADGELFCWLGDDDEFEPTLLDRSVELLVRDPSLILATTGVSWVGADGEMIVRPYDGTAMRSTDRADRFVTMLKMLNEDAAIDPLASLMRREPVRRIHRHNMMREDQIFATQLALAGPWGHTSEILLSRRWKHATRLEIAAYLDLPARQGRFTTAFQTRELMRIVSNAAFSPEDRHKARIAVLGHYVGWHRRRVSNGIRRVAASTRSRVYSSPPR